MLCDNCGKREAVVAYTKMKESGMEVVHLCAQCAKDIMSSELDFTNELNNKLGEFINEMMKFAGGESSQIDETLNKLCPDCKKSLKDILESNEVGCEKCYENFEEEIESILLSLNLTSSHKGKIPKTAGEESVKKREEIELNTKLNVAIALEEYEEAAKIRDRLKELKEKE